MFVFQAVYWQFKVLSTVLRFFETSFSIGETVIWAFVVISTKSLGRGFSPAPRACGERAGGGRGGQRETRQTVPRDRDTRLKFIFRWLLTGYLLNCLKTGLPTGYCCKFQLLTFPFPRDCSSKWASLIFHWILSFLDTSFPQPFRSRMQLSLTSALDLNLANPLPLRITKLGEVCLHIVLINQGVWRANPRLSATYSCESFRMKLDGKTFNFPLWSSHGSTLPFTVECQVFLVYRIFPKKIRNISLLNDTMKLTEHLSWKKVVFFVTADEVRNEFHVRKSY